MAPTSHETTAPAARSRLETLPAEVRIHVLSSLPSLEDLHAAVHASPVLYQQYLHDRQAILFRVLQNTLGDRGFQDAYAVDQTLLFTRPAWISPARAARLCLTKYSQTVASPPTVPVWDADNSHLIRMAAFYWTTVRPLLAIMPAAYFGNLNCLMPSTQHGHNANILSPIERTRLLRALYRFELWCNLFGMREGAVAGGVAVRPYTVLTSFFGLFRPWEVEEVACVHAFFMEVYYRRMGDRGSMTRARRNAIQNAMVSRGLEFQVQTLQIRDAEQLATRLTAAQRTCFNTIDDALSQKTQKQRRTVPVNPYHEDERLRCRINFKGDHENEIPYGWFLVWDQQRCDYFGGMLDSRIKRWGYVFWDRERLRRTRGAEFLLDEGPLHHL